VRYLNNSKFQAVTLSLSLAAFAQGLNQHCLAQQGQPSNPGQATKSTLTFKEAKERWKEEKKPARPNVNIDTFGKPEMLTAAKAVCDDIQTAP
jgi:hypothetical protein